MGEQAVALAKAVDYQSAGTVEFIVDKDRNFYFLEMNTRLQVEHPVTELVTGLDLVKLQIQVASGEPLPFRQEDVLQRGHAIECRIYAEDPENNFFPSPGQISRLIAPGGPGIREDSGVYEGWNVPLEYDPLLSKLIGYGETRAQAIARLRRALDEYFLGGIKTNLPLFRHIMRDEDFIAGNLDTGYLDRLLATAPPLQGPSDAEDADVAAIAAVIFPALQRRIEPSFERNGASPPEVTGLEQRELSEWKRAGRDEGLQS
jgi:acetyl-CoA carboxylase biotin carboxylase subunit